MGSSEVKVKLAKPCRNGGTRAKLPHALCGKRDIATALPHKSTRSMDGITVPGRRVSNLDFVFAGLSV